MKHRKCTAIVLQKTNQNEKYTDVILLTKEFGKISVKVRGLQNPLSKMSAKLEPIQEVDVDLYLVKEKVPVVTQVSVKKTYRELKESYELMQDLFFLTELLSRLLPMEEENHAVYMLTVATLETLSQQKNSKVIISAFVVKLLSLLGYLPHVRQCHDCEQVFNERTEIHLSEREGTYHCHGCKPSHSVKHVGFLAMKCLSFFTKADFDQLLVLKVGDVTLLEVESLLVQMCVHVLGRPLETLGCLGR